MGCFGDAKFLVLCIVFIQQVDISESTTNAHPCVFTSKYYDGTNLFVTSGRNMMQCVDDCDQNIICIGATFSIDGFCFLHDAIENEKILPSAELSEALYIKNCTANAFLPNAPRTSATPPTMSTQEDGQSTRRNVACCQFQNHFGLNLDDRSNTSTSAECFDDCDKNSLCMGATFDIQYTCWLHRSILTEDRIHADEGSVLYIKNCDGSIMVGGTEVVPDCPEKAVKTEHTSSFEDRSVTTKSTEVVPGNDSSCVYVDKFHQGHDLRDEPGLSKSECFDKCARARDCMGVTFNSAKHCWQHDAVDKDRIFPWDENFLYIKHCISTFDEEETLATQLHTLPQLERRRTVSIGPSSLPNSGLPELSKPEETLLPWKPVDNNAIVPVQNPVLENGQTTVHSEMFRFEIFIYSVVWGLTF